MAVPAFVLGVLAAFVAYGRFVAVPFSEVTCTTHIGTSVTAKRHWILGVSEEEMLRHCEELTTTKTMPFRRNPTGRWGLRAISLLRAVNDAKTSISVSRRDLARKTHRRWSRYGWYRSLRRTRLARNHDSSLA